MFAKNLYLSSFISMQHAASVSEQINIIIIFHLRIIRDYRHKRSDRILGASASASAPAVNVVRAPAQVKWRRKIRGSRSLTFITYLFIRFFPNSETG